MAQQETPYRPDIDGLRAISILLVVGYHAHPWLIPGGFVGVDVFFVISGFLITRIILTEVDAGSFSAAGFYARRIRRIFPALILVLAATYLIGWVVLLPDQFKLLGENIVAGVVFAANLFQLRQTGYFAPDASDNPLLHLWSLGVEEQFYIFWPLTILLASGLQQRPRWIGAVALASFAVGLGIFLGYRDWSFYSPLPRAWELLAGALLAERVLRSGYPGWSDGLSHFLGLLGIAAIIGSATAFDRTSLFPGAHALLPVLGAVLIIAAPQSFVNRILLASRPMVWIGLISYPLYLWHWPLLSYLAIVRNGVPNFLEIWAAVGIAVLLSWLTFRYIEIPLRRRSGAVAKLSFGLAFTGMVGIVTVIAAGFDFRFPPQVRDIARIDPKDNSGFRDTCFLESPGSEFNASCIEPGDQPLVFLWGDSNGAALYPGLKDAENRSGSFRLARFDAPACAPILDEGTSTRCDEANRAAFGFLTSAQPDIVLLHAMWGANNNLEKLRETIERLRARKIPRIVVLGPVPVWKRTLPHTLINQYRFRREMPDRIAVGVSGPENDQRMEAFSKAAGVEYVSAWRALCNADGCLTRAGADVMATDIVHLSDAGAKYLVGAIGKELLPISPAQPE
jgi:peptidoglycan/LPS O-acetylase OafA/YrhL